MHRKITENQNFQTLVLFFSPFFTVRLQAKGRALSWLGTLGFSYVVVFSCLLLVFLSFPRISESDVLRRCSYDSSLTVSVYFSSPLV